MSTAFRLFRTHKFTFLSETFGGGEGLNARMAYDKLYILMN